MLKKLHNAFYNCIHGGYWFKMYLEYYEESNSLWEENQRLKAELDHVREHHAYDYMNLRAANDTIESLEARLRAYEVK